MSEASTSEFVQKPKQARSRRTLERIARSALELIAEQGVEATTVAQIVSRAGSSIGSFYARFSGKDDLIQYLEERVWSDAQRRWDEALDSDAWVALSLGEVAEGLVRLMIQVARMAGKPRRALAFHASRDAGGPTPAQKFRQSLEAGVGTLLLGRREGIKHPQPSVAVVIGYRAVSAAIQDLVAQPPAADVARDDDALCGELTAMLLSYLGATSRTDEPPGDDVDFFEIWG